jgi:peptidoglycan/LPS O-acetylase OafA/YrhL
MTSSTPAISSLRATREKGRWEFLDATRGIAAFVVICQHGLERFYSFGLPWTVKHFNFGLAGVLAFFLVSGFIIPTSIERYNSISRFWMGRLFRLFPLYLASLIVILVLGYSRVVILPPAFYLHPVRSVLTNLTMMQGFLGSPSAIGVYWTLAYEMLFYILCSILFVAGILKKSTLWAWIATGVFLFSNLCCALLFHRALSAAKAAFIVTAFIGTLFFRNFSGKVTSRTLYSLTPFVLLAFGVSFWLRFSIYPQASDPNQFTFQSEILAFILGYSLFCVAFVLRDHEVPKPLIWLGRISYSVYLVHTLVLPAVGHYLSGTVGIITFFAATLCVSEVTYRFIEAPFVSFQHKILQQQPTTAKGAKAAPLVPN